MLALVAYACSSDDNPGATTPDGGISKLPDGSGSSGNVGEGSTTPPNDSGDTDASDAGAPCTDEDAAAIDCSYANDAGTDAGSLPGNLRCTGLYSCWSNKTVATTALAYTPGVQLWSDGADKLRWLMLPPGQKIDITTRDAWVFPVGTKAFKEFKLDGKRLETRIFQKVDDVNWEATVYRWSDDGETSAKRLDNGALVNGYEIPASNVCSQCHRGHADKMLGIEEWSLSIAGADGLTMQKLKDSDLVTPAPDTTTLTVPEDTTGKAAAAIGWLHANCGFCHNSGTGAAKFTGLFMNLVAGTDGGIENQPVWQTAVGVDPRAGSKFEISGNYDGFERITPHDATHSLIPALDHTRATDGGIDLYQMPPILSRKVDPKADSVTDWVNALPAP